MATKVLVAMSGGVDSAAAALLLSESGYVADGLTLRLSDIGDSVPLGDLPCERAAADVCKTLGISHFVADYREAFRAIVVQNFVDSYAQGKTPNPCVVCNPRVKFSAMLREADARGYDKIATGHYARLSFDEASGRYQIRRAADAKKDQSYMLCGLSQAQLSRILFPLGEMTKPKIRERAAAAGFVNADTKDSQDICFIPDGDYAAFIERVTKSAFPCGDFVDKSGNVLGHHKGLIRYTTGQRKGLGLALAAPAYVLDKDPDTNRVLLGTNEDLFSDECTVADVNWVSALPIFEARRAEVCVRYSHTASEATLIPLDGGNVRIRFDAPQRAITRGQAAVFYDGDLLLGGGTIL